MTKQLFPLEEVGRGKTPLAYLLRRISYGLGISIDRYNELHASFVTRTRRPPELIVSQRNNFRKSMLMDKPTIRVFLAFITEILNMTIVGMSVTIKDRTTGKEYTFSTTDPLPPEPGMAVGAIPEEDLPKQPS